MKKNRYIYNFGYKNPNQFLVIDAIDRHALSYQSYFFKMYARSNNDRELQIFIYFLQQT